jgi:putative membrane protein
MTTALADSAFRGAIAAAHVGGHWGPGFGGWFLLIPLFWIAVFAILFAVFGRRWRRAAMRDGYGPYGHVSPSRQAETTLAERYAQGDIDEVEYRKRLEVLRANAPQPPER